MNLAPGIRRFVAEADALYQDDDESRTIAEQRASYAAFSRVFDRPHPPGLVVTDDVVRGEGHDVPIRCYRPTGDDQRPCILYFHGGGWVLGSIDTHDSITADLAAEARAAVVSVDYRLAPEHPFPAAFEDSYAALCHVVANAAALGIDPDRIAVAGDSAGGNLAAAVALAARDRNGPRLRGQALIYPALESDPGLPSYRENADAPMLTTETMLHYWRLYTAESTDVPEAYAAPLRSVDLAGLPAAFIGTAQYDPVRDDGEHYAAKLRQAGISVDLRRAPRLVHGHLRARHICADAAAEFTALCTALRRLLALP